MGQSKAPEYLTPALCSDPVAPHSIFLYTFEQPIA
jgi:hypothetical protein